MREKKKQKLAIKKLRVEVKKQKKRDKKANNPRRLKLQCDKLWREEVIKLYGEKCIVCGNTNINIHHIISRANRAVRWYRGNGVPLCALHHTFGTQSAHQDPLWFRSKMIELRGDWWERDLMKESNKIWQKDFNLVKKYLNWEIDSYNSY